MKYLILSAFLLLCCLDAFAKANETKTFLVLFDKDELKEKQSSAEYIELNFFEKFTTKSYSGNSEAALLITVPISGMSECEIGEMLVQVNPHTWLPLQEIAFRIIDLDQSQEQYQAFLSNEEDGVLQPKNQLVRIKR